MKDLKILVVEDDPDDAELTLWSLRAQGIEQVTLASDGSEALRLLGEGLAPQVVLLDLRLPLVDGLEVLTRMRSDQALKAIKVIVLTSSENPRDQAVCQGLGVTAYLGKPLDAKLLHALLG